MQPSVENRAARERGFTLIETAFALIIMMIGGLGIAAVFAYAVKNNTGSRDRAAALAVAQQQMEQYRNMAFNDAGLTAADTTVSVTSADRVFTVRTTITDNATPATAKTVRIQVTPVLSGEQWARGTVELSVQRSSFVLGPYSGGP